MNVVVTGATGFVGNATIQYLVSKSYSVRAVVRSSFVSLPVGVESFVIDDLGVDTNFGQLLSGVDTVIHAAAKVHSVINEESGSLAEFRKINVFGTLNLARQAAMAKVQRFIFISSVKVNGEVTQSGQPFREDDPVAPVDPYGVSKLEAEVGLRALAAETGMEVVIIRPVLVYGPGVKANFYNLMKWLVRGVPLPLSAVKNRRSLIALENLVDMIATCISHPKAANETFFASDGEDLSITELLVLLGRALGKPVYLFPVPVAWFEAIAKILGKQQFYRRLCGSLQVDIEKARTMLEWVPPVSVEDGLCGTAEYFLNDR